jgi:uncharacterized membrane protein YozB (DUF420 family)
MTTIAPSPQRTKRGRPQWLVPAGLIILSLVPVIAGAFRLSALAGGDTSTESVRYDGAIIAVVAHIIGATVFCVLGAFQFVPRLRRGRPSWHRISGRIVLPAGLVAAFAGTWMAVFVTGPGADGGLLLAMRLVVGPAMFVFLLLGLRAILKRDIKHHSAWMMRAYAIGIGAGTQVITLLVFSLIAGEPNPVQNSVLMGLAWVINLAVAEYFIQRSRTSGRSAANRAAIR